MEPPATEPPPSVIQVIKAPRPSKPVLLGNEIPEFLAPPGLKWSDAEHYRTIHMSAKRFCRHSWMLRALQWYVPFFTILGYETTRLFDLHLKRHFEIYSSPTEEITSTYNPDGGYSGLGDNEAPGSYIMEELIKQYLINLQVHADKTYPTVVLKFMVLWLQKYENISLSAAKRRATCIYKKLVDPKRGSSWVKNGNDFQAKRLKYWRQLFRIKPKLLRHPGGKVVANRRYFNLMFRTNGVGMRLVTYEWILVPNEPKAKPRPKSTLKRKAGPKPMTQPKTKRAGKPKVATLAKRVVV
ncbi:hypothetical protein GGI17_000179 [Coemansia sp. S146]|nr:hypothetical protein GGI17_000179 [Coemansia sp. S146]